MHLVIIFTAFCGFLLAFYIYNKKQAKKVLICPLKAHCDPVVHSEYSRFFGIRVEILGMAYYGLIAVIYAMFLAFPYLSTTFLVFSILAISTIALLFSGYLTFIQAFALKQWCSWCLVSAGFTVIIFFLALFSSQFGFVSLLAEYHYIIVIFHFLGVALGIGGATFADIFFFKFLKDLRISEQEADILRTLSQAIWFALAILIVTGIGLYLPEAEEFNQSAKFLVKMIVVAVIIVNGLFLNLLIAPKLVKISFGKRHKHEKGELHNMRKLAFALGAISITSWYSAFILGMTRPDMSFPMLLAIYLVVLGTAILISQFIDKYFSKKAL